MNRPVFYRGMLGSNSHGSRARVRLSHHAKPHILLVVALACSAVAVFAAEEKAKDAKDVPPS
jgi:hypothetical protein